MNNELYSRLNNLRLDRYAVDQGLMLNCLVGALTSMVNWTDDKGNVKAEDIVQSVEQAFATACKAN
jgi:hypothetical protein